MFFPSAFVSLVAVAATTAAVVERQFPGQPLTILSPGSIQAPTDGTAVTAGDSFTLDIAVPEYNHCHPLYTPVDIYILADEPTTSSLNSTYQFSDYLYYFGEYVTTNIAGESYNIVKEVAALVTFASRCIPTSKWLPSPDQPDHARPWVFVRWSRSLLGHYRDHFWLPCKYLTSFSVQVLICPMMNDSPLGIPNTPSILPALSTASRGCKQQTITVAGI